MNKRDQLFMTIQKNDSSGIFPTSKLILWFMVDYGDIKLEC